MKQVEPLDPSQVTPAEWTATEEAARILGEIRQILDNE
jgi:hypothetical protein